MESAESEDADSINHKEVIVMKGLSIAGMILGIVGAVVSLTGLVLSVFGLKGSKK